jgi:hypothetical protein
MTVPILEAGQFPFEPLASDAFPLDGLASAIERRGAPGPAAGSRRCGSSQACGPNCYRVIESRADNQPRNQFIEDPDPRDK